MPFRDRADAGRRLAERLSHLRGQDVVVLGLPRGGVPVAAEVARSLGTALDVIVVRKLGVPVQPELGMGAIGEGGIRVLNPDVLTAAQVTNADIAEVESRERAELDRRARRFRGDGPPASLAGRTVVVIDDGIATGSTARAACQVVRAQGAASVILATPVAPPPTVRLLSDAADEVVVLEAPEHFLAIGEWYEDFSQTSDDEVVHLLRPGAAPGGGAGPGGGRAGTVTGADREVVVTADGAELPGHLTVPPGAPGVVLFAHGSGSSRHSPRNQQVAGVLGEAGLGTLLFDLLTRGEEADRANVFDVALLGRRLSGATAWLRGHPAGAGASIGYFGASTGAAAALIAAAEPGADVAAVVSRGGRPDLAIPRLGQVRAPTLLIVGGLDDLVLDLNRQAREHLRCENELAVVPGATHLFEEPGALERAAGLARDWFVHHLAHTHAGA